MAQATMTANLFDLLGAPVPNAKLRVQLAGYGSQIPRVAGTGIFASAAPVDATANAAGLATLSLYSNDAITPSGTYYTVTVLDASNNAVQVSAYQFTGSSNLDLSTAAIYNPNPVFPPTPRPIPIASGTFLRLPYSATPVFNIPGQGVATFAMLLTGDVLSSTFAAPPSPGQIIAFLISQDGAGGHRFTPPPNVIDAVNVATYGNGKTFQAYMAADDGNLYPFGVSTNN